MRDSTSQYRREEDVIGPYINERLVVGADREVAASEPYGDFTAWCQGMGKEPETVSGRWAGWEGVSRA